MNPAVDEPGAPASPHLHWDAEALWQALAPQLPGVSVEVLARTDSTNTQLLDRARAQGGRRSADFAPCLLVAEAQTAGRGRLGRGWASTPGRSLTFSLALPLAPADWGGLSLAIGVALAEALDPLPETPGAPEVPEGAPARIGLKWPNDLWLVDDTAANGVGRKLGGVLVETVAVGEQRLVVVGVGLNVQAPELGGTAPTLAATHGIGTLAELDAASTAPSALARVAPALAQALRRFEQQGFAPFAAGWARRDLLRGRPLAISGGGEAQQGLGDGVDADGALRLRRPDGGLARIVSGEASVRFAALPDQPPAAR